VRLNEWCCNILLDTHIGSLWSRYFHALEPQLLPQLTALFRDQPGEQVPEENFWTLWCKERLTQADTPTISLGATPSGLTTADLHHSPIFFTGRMPFLPPNQQFQSTEGNFSGTVTNNQPCSDHEKSCRST